MMTPDTYTFYSVAAGDWVTKCATCGAWWLAGAGYAHLCGPSFITDCCGVFRYRDEVVCTVTPDDEIWVCRDGAGCLSSDPHPSEGCGLCGWDGPEDTTPCPSHAGEAAAWNLRHVVSEPLPTRPANPAFCGTLRGISAGRQVGEP